MSLLSTDITKVKRLSLREVKLPAPELRVEPTTILVERPPTVDEVAYSRLVAINPLLEKLVNRLELVNSKFGNKPNRVELIKNKPQESKVVDTVAYLLNMAKAHAKKSKVAKEKYILAWVDSMEDTLKDNKISKEQFITLFLQPDKV